MGLTNFLIHYFTLIISKLGYLGIGALMTMESMVLPVPSEAVMPFAGFLWYDGRFSFEIPVADQKYQYNLRANKRIGLKLTPPVDQETGVQGESVSWCYNFSAELRSFDADGESVILNQFTTKLTQYKCQADAENGGIHIP